MANRLTDLDVGHAYVPSTTNFSNESIFGNSSDPSAFTVLVVFVAVVAAYTVVWRALTI